MMLKIMCTHFFKSFIITPLFSVERNFNFSTFFMFKQKFFYTRQGENKKKLTHQEIKQISIFIQDETFFSSLFRFSFSRKTDSLTDFKTKTTFFFLSPLLCSVFTQKEKFLWANIWVNSNATSLVAKESKEFWLFSGFGYIWYLQN